VITQAETRPLHYNIMNEISVGSNVPETAIEALGCLTNCFARRTILGSITLSWRKRNGLTLHIRGGLLGQCKKTTPNQDTNHQHRTFDFDDVFTGTITHNQTLPQENAALAVPCMWFSPLFGL